MVTADWELEKRSTGIAGLDRVTHGGLPRGQATLVIGASGSGKSVLSLQVLARAIEQGDGGVFVTFEESPEQVRRNAASFRWGRALEDSERWEVIDARPRIGAETSGEFDIDALLTAIAATAERCGGSWVMIDGIDQLLQRQPDRMLAIDQVRQLNEWCERRGWTVILSGKADDGDTAPAHLEGVEFMLPTMLVLTSDLVEGRMIRRLRVAKYRGSSHVTGDVPVLIDGDGIELPYHQFEPAGEGIAGDERVSTGVERLDSVLAGGLLRGSTVLVSGRPGTAKSTLAAAFAMATAGRGERTLYISFDELQNAYVRNLASVGIDLQAHIDAGRIRFHGLSAWSGPVAEHYLHIQRLIAEFEPETMVIDPVSALFKASAAESPRVAIERLVDGARRRGMTTLLTSLNSEEDREGESTLSHVSTLADTWIVLDYNQRGGERNRSLSVVKSRGSGHSNQMRELLLSDRGVDLAETYEYGSEVLMGTARMQKVAEEESRERREEVERRERRQDLERRIEQARLEQERLEAQRELEEMEDAEFARRRRELSEDVRRRREPGIDPRSEPADDPKARGGEPS